MKVFVSRLPRLMIFHRMYFILCSAQRILKCALSRMCS